MIQNLPEYLTDHYPQIKQFSVPIDEIARGTVVEEFWRSCKVQKSKYWLNNISNFLRLLLLYKFGGFYLDNDMISLKSLPSRLNILAQDRELGVLNNAFLGFEKGHRFIEDVLKIMVRREKTV